jgi:predicted transcriptional regulator
MLQILGQIITAYAGRNELTVEQLEAAVQRIGSALRTFEPTVATLPVITNQVELAPSFTKKPQETPSPTVVPTPVVEAVPLPTVSKPTPSATASPQGGPKVPIEESVADDHITCLTCGEQVVIIKRHLTIAHKITLDEYRTQWGLSKDYPTVAPAYQRYRSEHAKQHGLGKKKATGAPPPEEPAGVAPKSPTVAPKKPKLTLPVHKPTPPAPPEEPVAHSPHSPLKSLVMKLRESKTQEAPPPDEGGKKAPPYIYPVSKWGKKP